MTANKPYGKKKRDKPEERLHTALVAILRLEIINSVYWFHPANGEKRPISTGILLQKMGVRPGAPDLMFLAQGRFYGLELKAPKNYQSPSQRQTEKDIVAAGGAYAVAKSIRDALIQLVEWNLVDPGCLDRRQIKNAMQMDEAA